MEGSQTGFRDLYIFKQVPIDALNFASLRMLEEMLNTEGKMVELNDGSGLKVYNNFTGLAEQNKISPEEISDLEQFENPTRELLTEMADKNRTVDDLKRYLQTMGRDDIVEMSLNNWAKDCHEYSRRHEIPGGRMPGAQALPSEDPVTREDRPTSDFEEILEETKEFDAFLSYAYDDLKIAKRFISKLENHGFRIFVPGRDDLPGESKYVLIAYRIEKRCRRVIILLTRAFMHSQECEFQLNFSKALDPGARLMKIIPVTCEKGVHPPRFLNFVHTCDITKNEWQSLYKALSHQPHGQNTQLLEELRYPSPPNVEKIFKKGQVVIEREQPEGESVVIYDRTSLSDRDSVVTCDCHRSLPADDAPKTMCRMESSYSDRESETPSIYSRIFTFLQRLLRDTYM